MIWSEYGIKESFGEGHKRCWPGAGGELISSLSISNKGAGLQIIQSCLNTRSVKWDQRSASLIPAPSSLLGCLARVSYRGCTARRLPTTTRPPVLACRYYVHYRTQDWIMLLELAGQTPNMFVELMNTHVSPWLLLPYSTVYFYKMCVCPFKLKFTVKTLTVYPLGFLLLNGCVTFYHHNIIFQITQYFTM